MIRHRCHCGRRFILAASLHLHIATTHLLDNPQAAWDRHCATTPGLLSPGVVVAADFDLWEREVAQ